MRHQHPEDRVRQLSHELSLLSKLQVEAFDLGEWALITGKLRRVHSDLLTWMLASEPQRRKLGIPYFRWTENARARICPTCGARVATRDSKSQEYLAHWATHEASEGP